MPPLTQGARLDVDEAVGEYVRAVRAAEDELRAELSRVVEIVATDPNSTKRYREAQVRGLLGRLAEIRTDLEGQASLFTSERLGAIYADGMDRAQRALGLAGQASFTGVHRDALEVLASDTFDDLAAATDYLDASVKRTIREAAKIRTTVGAAAGTTVRRDTGALVSALESRGVTGFVDAAGRGWRLSTYAEMVVRTKSAHAYNTGTVLRAEETGTTVFEILDGERSGHPECLAYSRDTCTGAWALAHPVEHPNCVRSFSPLPLHRGPVDHGEVGERRAVDAVSRENADRARAEEDTLPGPVGPTGGRTGSATTSYVDENGNPVEIPLGQARQIGPRIDDLNNRFGNLVDSIVVADYTAYANAGGVRRITVNPTTFLDDAFVAERAEGMRPFVVGVERADTITHEYGHVIERALRDEGIDVIERHVPKGVASGNMGPEEFANLPSVYAGESVFEASAELFALAYRLDRGLPVPDHVPSGAVDRARDLLEDVRSVYR